MVLPDHLVINFHSDSAHHYLEVDTSLIDAFDVKITQFSFITPDLKKCFLECDVDGQNFIFALTERNISFQFEEIEHAGMAFFRTYHRVTETKSVH